jgi:tRNA pseudouridine38-40 synthase
MADKPDGGDYQSPPFFAMRNIKLLIEYDGTNYHGWQVQRSSAECRMRNAELKSSGFSTPHSTLRTPHSELPTIQGVLQEKLSLITKERNHISGSGRTDAGVHALGQVANFLTESTMPADSFAKALNSFLPKDIVILHSEEVAPDFHAQKSAQSKTYRYNILNIKTPSALHRNYTWFAPDDLDLSGMEFAAEGLVGTHDFSSFRDSQGKEKNPVRTLYHVSLEKHGDLILCYVAANGFLHHMVRNMVGTLVEIGRGKLMPLDMKRILEACDRRAAGPTAPPQGLYLVEVKY